MIVRFSKEAAKLRFLCEIIGIAEKIRAFLHQGKVFG